MVCRISGLLLLIVESPRHESAVEIILTNPHYTGDLVQGRSKVDNEEKLHHQYAFDHYYV